MNSIQFAEMQMKVFDALKEGKDALERINSQMSVDDVEQLMEDTAEAIAYQQEIEEVLGNALTEADNELVEAEYAALMAEDEEIDPDVLDLPAVPNKPIPVEKVPEPQVVVAQSEESLGPVLLA